MANAARNDHRKTKDISRNALFAFALISVGFAQGKEKGFQRLGDVRTRHEDPADFNEYVGAAIRTYLAAKE